MQGINKSLMPKEANELETAPTLSQVNCRRIEEPIIDSNIQKRMPG